MNQQGLEIFVRNQTFRHNFCHPVRPRVRKTRILVYTPSTSLQCDLMCIYWVDHCICPALRNIWNLRSSLFTPKPQIFVCWLFVLMEPCWHIYCLQICHTEWNMHQKCETNGTKPCSFRPFIYTHIGVSLKEHCKRHNKPKFWVLDWMFQMYNLVSKV